MYTIKDVAKKASVSIGTVSNYINKTKPVHPKTAQKIEKAIDELHFSPNHAARILKTKHVKEIGVILPHMNDPYYAAILRGIEKELRSNHYDMSLIFTEEMPSVETKALENFIGKNMAGILLITCQPSETETFSKLIGRENLPAVFIDRKPDFKDINFIGFDNYRTVQFLMEQILLLNSNAQIGLMVGNPAFFSERECVQSFMDTLEKYHLDAPSPYIRYTNATKEDAFKSGIDLLKKTQFDFIITSSEQIAYGLNEATSLLNLETTRIISLGEDNWMDEYSSRNLIKTNRMAQSMGQEAVRLLFKNIESSIDKLQLILQDKIIGRNLLQSSASPNIISGQDIELKIALLSAPITKAMAHIVTHFTYKTGIPVKLTLFSQEELLDFIMSDSQTLEGAFDVYMYDLPWLNQLASNHCLMDLTKYMVQENFDSSIYIPNLMENLGCYQQCYYGVPYLFSSQILLYRSDLFHDSDLQKDFLKNVGRPLLPPKSWLEFNTISEFFTGAYPLKSPVPYGTSIAGKTQEILVPEFLCRLWAYKGRLFDDQNKLLINTPEFKKALQTFIQTYRFCKPGALDDTIESTVDDFLQGHTAMLITYSTYLHDLSNPNISKIIGKYSFQTIPGRQPLLGGWALGISPHSKNPEASFSWINWACGAEISNYFTILEGQSPIKAIYSNDEMINLYPWLPLIYETHHKTNLRRSPQHPRRQVIPMDQLETILFKHLRTALTEQITPDEAIILIHNELSQLFRCYGY